MTYVVIVTAEAKSNLRHYYHRAAQYDPETATRWLARFEAALSTLAINPQRCPLAPENGRVEAEIREYHFGKGRNVFRVLLTIESNQVRIVHIRRATMDWAEADDLQ